MQEGRFNLSQSETLAAPEYWETVNHKESEGRKLLWQSTVQCFLFFLCFSSSPLTLSLSLSSPVRKDLCICLYRCVYWCKCLRSTTTVICFLEVAEGIQTVCIYVSAMLLFFFFFTFFFFYLSSFSLEQRMQQLGNHAVLFGHCKTSRSLQRMHFLISLYPLDCVTGSLSSASSPSLFRISG